MPSDAQSFSQSYAALATSVPEVRRTLTEFAIAAGADRPQVEAVRLAASEAFTNSVVHAYGNQWGQVHVTAAVVDQEIWVLIADDGRGLEPRSDRPGLGLGLALIAQLTDHLTIVPRAGGGTEVRMRFNFAGSAFPAAPSAETPAERRSRVAR